MPRKKLQIFVSSTYLDLQEDRQAAVSAILKAGHIPAGMELFTAGDESQWETITRWIDESDIYMLILGGRYGSTHPTSGQGYTEMEYDYAVASGKPYFAVVIRESELDERVKTRGKEILELEHPGKLKEFREKVLGRMSSFFVDAKDIKLAIHETIPVLEQKHNPIGWISGAEFTDAKPLVDELTKRGEEINSLRKEVSRLQKEIDKAKAKSGDNDFEELQAVLSKIEVNTGLANVIKGDASNTFSLMKLAFSYKETLASGVTNRSGIGDIERMLFFQVCSKLQMYDLAEIEKVTGVTWRRYLLTAKGRRFFAEVEKATLEKD